MKTAYIMRGIPGSGKSTVAKALAGANGVIHSTDSYFMVDGKYQFDPSKLGAHHTSNLSSFAESCRVGIEVVICDNTNINPAHYQPYYDIAENMGYMVHVLTVGGISAETAFARNSHGVPLHAVQRMYDQADFK